MIDRMREWVIAIGASVIVVVAVLVGVLIAGPNHDVPRVVIVAGAAVVATTVSVGLALARRAPRG